MSSSKILDTLLKLLSVWLYFNLVNFYVAMHLWGDTVLSIATEMEWFFAWLIFKNAFPV